MMAEFFTVRYLASLTCGLVVGGKMGSEWILGRLASGVWIGFDWLRTGTGDGLL
jgi:hypothetical protein